MEFSPSPPTEHPPCNERCINPTWIALEGICKDRCPDHCLWNDQWNVTFRGLCMRNVPDMYLNKELRRWETHCVEVHGAVFNRPSTTHKGNGAPQGAFAFTLTKSPADEYSEEDMIKAVRKVMNQKSQPTVKFAWYLEYGDDEQKTHPHIHGMYETEDKGRIETKHWKRAWPIWDPKQKLGKGFRGGYHRLVRDDEAYDDYIKKDGGVSERFNC